MRQRIQNEFDLVKTKMRDMKPFSLVTNKREFSNYLIDSFNLSTAFASAVNHFLWDYSISYPDINNHRRITDQMIRNISATMAGSETLALKYLAHSTGYLLANMKAIDKINQLIVPDRFVYLVPATRIDVLEYIIKEKFEPIREISESKRMLREVTRPG